MAHNEPSKSLKSFLCLNSLFLVYNLVQRNLKIRYRKSFLGYLWTILVPLALTCIYYFVFKVVLKVSAENFWLMVVVGIMIWGFISMTLVEGMESLVSNFTLLRQVKVPLNCFSMAATISNFLTFVFSLPIILLFYLFSSIPFSPVVFICFYYFALLFVLAFALAYLFSIAVVYVRDLKQGLSILLQIWFYATPIVYQADLIPVKYRWVLWLNPLGFFFKGIQESLLQQNFPRPEEILLPLAWTTLIFLVAFTVNRFLSPRIVEMI